MLTNLLNRIRKQGFSVVQQVMVLLACAASLLSSQVLLPAAALIVVAWLMRWLVSRGKFRGAIAATPADLSIVLLMGMAAVSLLITPLPELTRPPVLRLFIGIATYYAVAEATAHFLPSSSASGSSSRAVLLLISLTLIGTALAVIAPFSVDWYANKGFIPAQVYSRFIVLLSDSVHPNVMGGTRALFLPFSLALILFFWPRMSALTRVAALVATGGMLLILVLTQSRSAYAALAASALCLGLLRLAMNHPRAARSIGIAALIGLGFVLAGLVLQLPPFDAPVATTEGIDATVAGRIEIWSRGIYMVQDFPFTGIGMGLHPKLIEVMYPYFINPVPLLHAHNLFLQVAVDLGLPGLITWLATLIITLTCAVSLYRRGLRSATVWQAGLGAGLIASQLALVVGGLTDAVTWGSIRTAPLVWIIWGVAVGSWMQAYAPQQANAPQIPNQPEPQASEAAG